MNRIGWGMSILAAALALVSQVEPASAARRTYVAPSPRGDDRNLCTRQDPCESLAHALTQTDHDGELIVLEPGGYGPVTIDKSVTIDGGGYHGEILSTQSWAIKIEAGINDKITLRNLFLDGGVASQSGGSGIVLTRAGSLRIENCTITNFGVWGIQFTPAADNPLATLFIDNTVVAGNGKSSGGGGINIAPQQFPQVRAVLNRVRAENNHAGITVDGNNGTQIFNTTVFINVTVQASAANGNATNGFTFTTAANRAPIAAVLDGVTAASNLGAGVEAHGPLGVLVGNSTIILNKGGGLSSTGGGAFGSYKNNQIDANSPTNGTPVPQAFLN